MRNITPGSPYKIGATEAKHILISVLVLSVAFAIIFRGGSIRNYFYYYFGDMWFAVMFGFMVLLTLVSFVGHEFGHKFVAQKYGLWSEYRMYPFGLLLTLVLSLTGFLIAAPGAVIIRGTYMTQEQNGKISIAGPLVNIVLAVIGLVGTLLFNHTAALVPFYLLFTLNSALALFNLIPIPPLDGSKVMNWNPVMWGTCIALAAIAFAARFFLPDLYFG